MNAANRRFRVSLARMAFAELEIEATDPLTAEVLGRRADGLAMKFETGNIVHRVEERIPVPGKPGEFEWVEIKPAI